MIRTVCLSSLIVLMGFSLSVSFAEDKFIPNWIKEVAGFWSQDEISDQDFLNGLQYLIDSGLLHVSDVENLSFSENKLRITVHTNKQQYGSNDDIVIFGTVSKLVDDHKVSLVVSSSQGTFMSITKVSPNIDGSYAFVAKDPQFKEFGKYVINVYYAGQANQQASYSFTPKF